MLKDLIALIVATLGIEDDGITENTLFVDDLGMDSLDAIDVVTAVEDKYDIEVEDKDLDSIKSVGNALTYIQNKLNEKEKIMAKATVTENEMAHEVHAEAVKQGVTGVNIEEVGKILDIFEDKVKGAVVAGKDVKMRHFGTFTAVEFKARNRYNPATKQTEAFPAVTKVKFEGSDEFNNALNA
jgi:acyl carrier protein